jgi:molybdenum cofactor cytidylyltransferase
VTGVDPVAGRDDGRRTSRSHLAAPSVAPAGQDRRRVVAVVLAAGTGSRFGGTKPVADLEGRPLVGHVVAAAVAAGVDAVHVVVGHDAEAVAAAAQDAADVEVVHNPGYAAGQATSLQAGLVSAEAAGADVAVVLLADEPDVTPEAIAAVTDAIAVGGGADLTGPIAARARYDDASGHPVAFARSVFGRLRDEVGGDRGARDVLAGLDVHEVPVAGRRPRDLDHPEDLERRRRR